MGPERRTMKPNITREQQNLKSRSNALHVSIQKTIKNVTMHFFLQTNYFRNTFANISIQMQSCCNVVRCQGRWKFVYFRCRVLHTQSATNTVSQMQEDNRRFINSIEWTAAGFNQLYRRCAPILCKSTIHSWFNNLPAINILTHHAWPTC